jgi:hypothetical protein
VSLYVSGGLIVTSGGSAVSDSSAQTFDFYVSNTGSDANAGTIGSPWSINFFNSKLATYTGKRVGFIAGSYNVPSLYVNGTGANWSSWATYAASNGSGDGYTPLFNVRGGSSGSPTYFGCVSGQGTVTFNCSGGTPFSCAQPFASSYTQSSGQRNYITWDGFVFDGLSGKGLMFGVYTAASVPIYVGQLVLNCEFSNQSISGCTTGINYYCVEFNSATGATVQNCYFHTGVGRAGGKDGDHYNAVNAWGSTSTTFDHCTVIDIPGFYGKEGNNQGVIVTNCYMDMSGWTGVYPYQDGAGVPPSFTLTANSIIRNNVTIGGNIFDLEATLGNGGWTIGCEFSNNTVRADASSNPGVFFRAMCQNTYTGLFTIYNNIFDWNGRTSSSYGNVSMTVTNGCALIDYNLYGRASWYSTPAGTYTSLGGTGYSTLANWQAAMSGATGDDAHSVVSTTYGYAGTGTRATLYKLSGSSAGFNTGSTNGTTGGSATDMGAWGGANAPSQIGCSFAQ